MKIPLLDLKAQFTSLEKEIRAAIERVLESQNFILGPEVVALEEEVAEYCRTDSAIGVSSGTDALLISLMAIDLKPGDEVITTPYSFFATAGCIARLAARPVFVDIDPRTYNIDPQKIEGAITEKTRAIIPVHLFGQMAEMDPIMELADEHSLFVIEDAAQAIGAEYHGRRAGSIGHFGCFSFFPSKNLGAMGDGGMVTTQVPELADRLRLLRNHGHRPKYHNRVVGGNFRLDAIQAAVLRVKLKYLDLWTEQRQENAGRYRTFFEASGLTSDISEIGCVQEGCSESGGNGCRLNASFEIVLPLEAEQRRHIYNQFIVRLGFRDQLMENLKSAGIGCEVYYPVPFHLQECFRDLGYSLGDFPASECAARQTLAIPIYPELTEEMIRYVVESIDNRLKIED